MGSRVFDCGNIEKGYAASSGRIFDSGNIEIGYAASSGRIYDSGNIEVGYVGDGLSIELKGGAARLLLLK